MQFNKSNRRLIIKFFSSKLNIKPYNKLSKKIITLKAYIYIYLILDIK